MDIEQGSTLVLYHDCDYDQVIGLVREMTPSIDIKKCGSITVEGPVCIFFCYLSRSSEECIESFQTCLAKAKKIKNLKFLDHSLFREEIQKFGGEIRTFDRPSTPDFHKWLVNYLEDHQVLWDLVALYKEQDTTLYEYTVSHIPRGWEDFFSEETLELVKEISPQIQGQTVYPPLNLVYNVFNLIKPKEIKVVIIGQDPYINEGEAQGIAFSVPRGKKIPPSLRNIFQELKSDGYTVWDPTNGDLTSWCTQGVFLINTALTVRAGQSRSHFNLWVDFTSALMNYLNFHCKPLVVIMWGKDAQAYEKQFGEKHKKIKSVHPSPLSASGGFFGSKPFSTCNRYLKQLNKEEIVWNL